MKKVKYRIRIETKRNSEKLYYAQRNIYYGLVSWANLNVSGNPVSYNHCYASINDAEKAIIANKKLWNESYQEEIINIEYKHID